MEHLSDSLQKVQLDMKKPNETLTVYRDKVKEEYNGVIPNFIKGELEEGYHKVDLPYQHVYLSCKELGRLKMVDIPKETIIAWYKEFIKAGWDKELFDKRHNTMKRTQIYGGSFDVYLWFETEETFTQQELNAKVKAIVDNLIKKGNYLLQGQIIEVTLPKIELDLDAIRVAVAKRAEAYYKNETERTILDVVDEVLQETVKRLNLVSKTVEV